MDHSGIEVPKDLLNALKSPQKETPGPSQVWENKKAGERNEVLFKEACSLRKRFG